MTGLRLVFAGTPAVALPALAAVADSAHEVYPITDAQIAEWRKAAEPLAKTWADNVKKTGGDPEKIMRELKASLAKYNAAY